MEFLNQSNFQRFSFVIACFHWRWLFQLCERSVDVNELDNLGHFTGHWRNTRFVLVAVHLIWRRSKVLIASLHNMNSTFLSTSVMVLISRGESPDALMSVVRIILAWLCYLICVSTVEFFSLIWSVTKTEFNVYKVSWLVFESCLAAMLKIIGIVLCGLTPLKSFMWHAKLADQSYFWLSYLRTCMYDQCRPTK